MIAEADAAAQAPQTAGALDAADPMAGAPDVAVLAGAAVVCETGAWNQRCPRAPVAQLAEPDLVDHSLSGVPVVWVLAARAPVGCAADRGDLLSRVVTDGAARR